LQKKIGGPHLIEEPVAKWRTESGMGVSWGLTYSSATVQRGRHCKKKKSGAPKVLKRQSATERGTQGETGSKSQAYNTHRPSPNYKKERVHLPTKRRKTGGTQTPKVSLVDVNRLPQKRKGGKVRKVSRGTVRSRARIRQVVLATGKKNLKGNPDKYPRNRKWGGLNGSRALGKTFV